VLDTPLALTPFVGLQNTQMEEDAMGEKKSRSNSLDCTQDMQGGETKISSSTASAQKSSRIKSLLRRVYFIFVCGYFLT